jgi:hypothetical protein
MVWKPQLVVLEMKKKGGECKRSRRIIGCVLSSFKDGNTTLGDCKSDSITVGTTKSGSTK